MRCRRTQAADGCRGSGDAACRQVVLDRAIQRFYGAKIRLLAAGTTITVIAGLS